MDESLNNFWYSQNEKHTKSFFFFIALWMEKRSKKCTSFCRKVRWKFIFLSFFTCSLMKISRQKLWWVFVQCIQTYKHFAMRKHENLINCYSFWYGSLFSNIASSSCFGGGIYTTLKNPQKWNLHRVSEQNKTNGAREKQTESFNK